MLTIRLQRTGKKNQADFRIVLAEKHKSVSKKFKEILGSFNPRKKLFRIISEARVKELIEQNVNISPTVHNLFVSQSLLQGNKVQSFKIKKKKVEEKSSSAKASADEEKKEAPAKPVEGEESKSVEVDGQKPTEEKPEDKPKEEPKPEKKEEEVKTEDRRKKGIN